MDEHRDDGDLWLALSPAARILQRSEQWTRALIDAGRIKSKRDSSGRRLVHKDELDRILREREGAARA